MSGLTTHLGQFAARAFGWWTGELKSVIPASFRATNATPKSDAVVLVRKGVIVSLLNGGRGREGEETVLSELSRSSTSSAQRITIRVPAADCLVRPFSVPRQAISKIVQIAELDLERAAPFRHGDVYSAVLIKDSGSRSQAVPAEQYVLKRRSIAEAAAGIEAAGATVVGIDCYLDDPSQPLPFDFLQISQHFGAVREKSAGPLLLALTILLGLSALAVLTHRYEAQLAGLKQETAALGAQVAALRRERDEGAPPAILSLLALKSKYPPVVEVLEDIARIIPDTAYLTNLRLNDGSIDIGGFGRPVTNLAPQLEQSPLIESAAITAPISMDEALQKERFDLRLMISARNPVNASAPAEAATP